MELGLKTQFHDSIFEFMEVNFYCATISTDTYLHLLFYVLYGNDSIKKFLH